MSDSGKAVFLSYASQDAEAAKRICEALRSSGVEVWFDAEGGLEHGDEWDAKIRRQIKECVLFLPIISANTQAREEGYFRIEWELAAQRALGIASGVAFILPIVIDDTREPDALVPDRFRSVQWTRLRGGELTPEVKARFLKLWSHRAGVVKHQAEDGGRKTEDRPETRDPRTQNLAKPSWKAYAGLAAAIFTLVAVAGWWLLRSSPPASGPATAVSPLHLPPASGAVATAPQSEARKLAERGFQLSVDNFDSTQDDFAVAEDLLKRALALDPEDGEIWAYAAQLNLMFRNRGFDFSPERVATGRQQAERAVRLAPGSAEAIFAVALAHRYTNNRTAYEQSLERVVELSPGHARALMFLGGVYTQRGQMGEGLALLARARLQSKWAPLVDYFEFLRAFSGRDFAAAEAAIRQSHAAKPSANSAAAIAVLHLAWKGDLDAAARFLAGLPPALLTAPRVVWATAELHLVRRDPERALRTLDRLSDDFLSSSWYTGPKAYLVGRAHALAGREAAARIDWEKALTVIEQKLKQEPGDPVLHRSRGEVLACLGRADEALAEARTVAEINRGQTTGWTISEVTIYAVLGRADLAGPLLEKQLDMDAGWPLTPALLRVDPRWDKLRGDARFQKLLAEVEAKELAARPARDWPKDPELKRAIDLIEGLDSIPDDFSLAEEIAKRAVDRGPADVEAVTVMARVQSQYLRRGFDRTDERSALARRYAERALQLAPDEPEAMLALATYLFSRATDAPRAERLLRRAMEIDPANPRHGRQLADLLLAEGRPAEGLAQSRETARRFPGDVLARYDLARQCKDQGLYEEFDRELDATLAIAPLPNAIVWKARLQFGLHNDFAGMKTWLDRVPERVRGTERAVFGYFLYAAFGGQAEAGLEALRGFPQKWFSDFEYAGPTALLNASLLELQGKAELARQQYEAALGEIQRMRASDPDRTGLSNVEFWTLLGLGRKQEARESYRRVIEGARRPYAQSLFTGWWYTAIPASLLLGERATALTLLRESVATLPESRAAIRLRFQMDPRMAPFRDDPEIVALLAEPEKAKP